MPSPKIFSVVLVALSYLALTACGGGTDPTPAQDAIAPEPEPSFPRMACPEGSVYRESVTAHGVEQLCEASGVKHGPFRRWYDEELREVDGNYKHGKADGAWVWWYPDGTKKSKGNYKDRKQSGSWTWWHENGTKIEEGDFLVGRKAGTWTRWYESGMKLEEGMFHNGVKNGQWDYRRDDVENTIKRTEVWQAGVKKETKYYAEDGKKVIPAPLPSDIAIPETTGQAPEEPVEPSPEEEGQE